MLIILTAGCRKNDNKARIIDGGTCGSDVIWTIDEENVLTISGDGEMNCYADDENAVLTSMKNQYPITRKLSVYILDPGCTEDELKELEGYLLQNTDYDLEQLRKDYALVGINNQYLAAANIHFAE